jgi:glycosyltransferase involved in cell wall biosynthesis
LNRPLVKFSIIIPTYNSAPTIQRSIKSILNQTFEDFEILIMDGKSSDETIEIVKSFKDQRIRFFSEKDKGVYDAMNNGITQCCGEWLYFLGSDDALFNPDVLKIVSNVIDKAEVDVVYGNVKFVNDDNQSIRNKIYDGKFNSGKLFIQNICHQAIFYKKAFVNRIGYYDLNYPILADYDFNLKAWKKGIFKFIDLIVAEFALGGLSSKPDLRFEADYMNNIVKYFYGFASDSKWNPIGKGLVKCQIIIQKIKSKVNRSI